MGMDVADRDQQGPSIEVPHDTVNEQVLLAAALVSDEIRALLPPKLSPDLFVDRAHQAVWAALRGMQQQGLSWSVQTLHQLCAGESVELEYLTELMRAYPTPPANVEHHVAALRWDSIRAEAVRGPVTDLLRALRDPTTPRDRVRALGRQVGQALDASVDRRFMRDPTVLASEHAEEMAHRAVYPYGIDGLDLFEDGSHRIVPGAVPGQITLVTAVSGACKSVFAARIALEQARMRHRVLYGAWEMGSGDTLEMMAIMSLGWSRYRVSTGQLGAGELAQFRDRMEAIGTYVRFFDPPFHGQVVRKYDNNAALDELYRCVADSGAELTVLDLWERCIPDGQPEEERRALFRTQQIFKQTKCHGLLVCQQKLKEIEQRADKRPTRSTILGSQAFVDIGDTILGLHRPGQWKPIEDSSLWVGILKQRRGRWPLAVEFDWDGDRCTIQNGRTVEYDAPGASRLTAFQEEFLGPDAGGRRRG